MINENTACYGGIVIQDEYKLLTLDFVPDVIIDIGANVGVFTYLARALFPQALIVAVEPHPANFAALSENAPKGRVVLLEKALGFGQVWRYPDLHTTDDSQTTTGETYISEEFGYTLPDIEGHPLDAVPTEGVMLDALYAEYVRPSQRLLIKIDCEGAENVLFSHQPSMDVLRKADFITMELHPYWAERARDKWVEGQTHETDEAVAARVEALLSDTFHCTSESPMFYARKKP